MVVNDPFGAFLPKLPIPERLPITFHEHLKKALESFDQPELLGSQSPLAAPYFLGEALRAAEQYAEARDTATQAIDRDPGFGAALISRAASWVGLGFPQEANADLVFLETAWAALPGYDALIERLALVVR